MTSKTEFRTDWFSAPASTVLDVLQERGLSVSQFVSVAGLPSQKVMGVLFHDEQFDQGFAERLSAVLGASPDFWMLRQQQFQTARAHEEKKADPRTKAWLAQMPVRELLRLGWIESKVDASVSCLNFFGVSNVEAWHAKYHAELSAVKFRTSQRFESDPFATLAWLEQGKILSRGILCGKWSEAKLIGSIPAMKELTWEKDPKVFFPKLQDICASSGVAVVAARTPKGCRASGATRFLTANKAMILLSFRFLSDDHFWFSFFHELGHVVLHDTKALFLEEEIDAKSEEELEANRFAEDVLVPSALRNDFRALKMGRYDIVRFARVAGVSPGIIVGQLQHSGRLPTNRMNWMKRRYQWSDS